VRLVGLTGGIATGKSTVARILREQGVPVLDADCVAREVVASGPVRERIIERFPEVFDADGTLNRPRLRALVARNPEARRALESLTHPEIRRRIDDWVAAQRAEGAPIAVVEAALLVETGSYRQYPELLVVRAGEALQRERLAARDGSPDDVVTGLLAAQASMEHKARVATAVLDNVGTVDELRAAVLFWLAGGEPAQSSM
jgi:dephospho-CoA kinase